MSLRFQMLGRVPEDTARVVKAAFRKGHPYIAFADGFGAVFDCDDFTELYSRMGQSAVHPGRLAMALILAAAEGLSDKQAAEAVRRDLLWKYVLRLPVEDEGWDYSVFSEFRTRLLENGAERLLFDKLLHVAAEKGLLKTGRQRTDSTHVIAAVRALNRLELVHETVRNAIEQLMNVAPSFILSIARPDWRPRYYEHRSYNYQLPNTDKARETLSQTVGQDGFYLLAAVDAAKSADRLRKLKSVVTLRRVWEEQYAESGGPTPGPRREKKPPRGLKSEPEPECNEPELEHEADVKPEDNPGAASEGPKFRDPKDMKASGERIASPHDTDARTAKKRSTVWTGYKVHFTETCVEGAPNLLTNVETTAATTNDSLVLTMIHRSLLQRGLKPAEHLLDSGYVQVHVLADSLEQHGIDVMSRLVNGHTWQSLAGKGFDLSHFVIDWAKHHVTCPTGVTSEKWKQAKKNDDGMINVSFPAKECRTCPFRTDCTKSEESRKLQIKPQRVFDYMQAQHKRWQSAEYRQAYGKRSGIEGTISQAVRRTDIRHSKYKGLEKTHQGNLLKATAVNFLRLANFLMGSPVAGTRKGRYEMATAAA